MIHLVQVMYYVAMMAKLTAWITQMNSLETGIYFNDSRMYPVIICDS